MLIEHLEMGAIFTRDGEECQKVDPTDLPYQEESVAWVRLHDHKLFMVSVEDHMATDDFI